MRRLSPIAPLALTAALVVASCGGSSEPAAEAEEPAAGAEVDEDVAAGAPSGLATITAADAASVIDAAPPGLVVLDIRTPEEFAAGHLDGAVLVDFYEPDFSEQLAALDRDVPYVLYCRSGNRSGEALQIMDELGFASVGNVDGGILAWAAAGLPVVVD